MNDSSESYFEAYEAARHELVGLLAEQQRLEKKKLALRKTLEALAALCAAEGIDIETSTEAASLLENTGLSDEIRTILAAEHPEYISPHQIKADLERLGWDLTKYANPQATIQMVLKRLMQGGEVLMSYTQEDHKQIYRARPDYIGVGIDEPGVLDAKSKISDAVKKENEARKKTEAAQRNARGKR